MSSRSNRLRNDLSYSASSQLTKYSKGVAKENQLFGINGTTFSNFARFYSITMKRCFVTYLSVRHSILLFFWACILTDPHKQASICLDEEDFKKKNYNKSFSFLSLSYFLKILKQECGTKKSAPVHTLSQINMDWYMKRISVCRCGSLLSFIAAIYPLKRLLSS